MALINISGFTKNEIESESGVTVEFDGYLNVTQSVSNIVTRRPVEEGFDLNDAIHNTPIVLAVEIIITDTGQTVLDLRSGTNLPNIFGTKLFQTHTKRQLNNLQEISNLKETVSFKTKYSDYQGYILENFSYSETDEQGLRVSFSLVEKRTDAQFEASSNISDSIGLWT